MNYGRFTLFLPVVLIPSIFNQIFQNTVCLLKYNIVKIKSNDHWISHRQLLNQLFYKMIALLASLLNQCLFNWAQESFTH